MNATLNKIDPVNATVTIDITKEDYTKEVEKSIKDLRKKVDIPGFRKGMVPIPRIQQLYGKSVLIEEINKLVINKLNAYIEEEKLDILGEPLPSVEEIDPSYFNKREDYSFTFDIGLTPDINIKLSKEDKLPYYLIEITDDILNKRIDELKSGYGNYDNVEEVEERDIAKGVLTELDENGNPKESGILNENTTLMPLFITDEEEKAKFIDAKVNTIVVFNPYKAYEGNTTELSSFLKIKKDEIKNYTGDFSLEIKEITRYKTAEINQELFDKLFEPGTVTTEEAFREKVKEIIAQQQTPESDYLFLLDTYKYLKEKVGEMIFPETFLKRWMLAVSPEKTPEFVETEFPKVIENLKSYAIKKQLIKDYKINVDHLDILKAAEQTVRDLFAKYGMNDLPEQLLNENIAGLLKTEESIRRMADKSIDIKMIDLFKEKFTIENQTVTKEEFLKLCKEAN
jgi:trigger factor